jgi:hypothetical protein
MEINFLFRRTFDGEEILEWEELEEVQSNTEDDIVRWALTKHEQFTNASLYRHCSLS